MKANAMSEQAERIEADAYESMTKVAEQAGIPGFRSFRTHAGLALLAPSLKNTIVFNRFLCLGVDSPATESQLDQLIEFYAEHGIPWSVELAAVAQPESVRNWLRERRIRRSSAAAVLASSTHDSTDAQSDLEIRCWRPEDGAAAAELAVDVFGVPEETRALLAELPHAPDWRQWLAIDGDAIAAAGLLYVGDGLGWTGWAATRPEYRGRGLHGALIQARLRDAAKHGCQWVFTDTATGTATRPDTSYKNHLRRGFQVLHARYSCLAIPGIVTNG